MRFAALTERAQADAKRLLRQIRPQMVVGGDVRVQPVDGEHGPAPVADLFAGGRRYATPLLWIAFFVILLNVSLVINWFPTLLNASGFTQEQAALIASMYHLGGVAGAYTLGLSMDRVGLHVLVMAAFLLASLGFYVFASTPTFSELTATAGLMTTGFGVVGVQVALTALAAMIYPVAMRATGLGWALGIGRVGSIVGPAIGGLLFAAMADARAVYLVCMVPALVGLACVAVLKWSAAPGGRPAEAI